MCYSCYFVNGKHLGGINNKLAETRTLPNPGKLEKEAQFKKIKFTMSNCKIAHIHTALDEQWLENTRQKQIFEKILGILEAKQ